MKKVKVKVCVCTECVMNGAMDIIESIEGLKKLKVQLRLNSQFQVETDNCLTGEKHHGRSPLVMVEGELLEKCTSETVMSKILSHKA